MTNDLPPQSQPWVREVEQGNAETASKLASIRTESEAQRRATQGVLSGVAARTIELRTRAAKIRNFKGANAANFFGVPVATPGEWMTLAATSVRSLSGQAGNADYLVIGSIMVSHSSNGEPGRIRLVVNGDPSVSMAFTGYIGFNYSSVATSGSVVNVSRLDIELQATFNNPDLSQSTVEQYYNCARFNVGSVWS